MFKVAILGRPNVGKSTLFNRLMRQHKATIYDEPGVTRDYNEGICTIANKKIIVIDSPGWGHNDEFSEQTKQNIVKVIKNVNLIVLLLEPILTMEDRNLSLWLRKSSNLPVLLVINKCDRRQDTTDALELGWDNIINISAQECIGLATLRQKISSYVTTEDEEEEVATSHLKIAIVGRPNAGKSTLINQLIKESRVISSPIPGTTRDSIEIKWKYKNQEIMLIDTAGIRKKNKIDEAVESSSVGLSINAIRQADVVVLLLDATRGFEHQDLAIVNLAKKSGKPFVAVINKSDLSTQTEIKHITLCCSHHLSPATSVITIAAINGKNCNKIIDACLESNEVAQIRISTTRLNKWLAQIKAKHEPPLSSRGTPIKLKFISQVSIKPFVFKIVANIPEDIGKDYIRYLTNQLRIAFNLKSSVIKIKLEKNHNPYV